MLQASPLYAYIPARDIARARRFYEDKVGLRAKEETNGGVVRPMATQPPPEPKPPLGPQPEPPSGPKPMPEPMTR